MIVQTLASWAQLACKLLGDGDAAYRLSVMYIEFENVVDPNDDVTVPEIAIDSGRQYYADLSLDADRDFLRVPLYLLTKDLTDGTTGTEFDRITLAGQSSGNVGMNGKTFSAGANSKVFGLAIGAAPSWEDWTQDVLYARAYYETGEQVLKPASGEVTLTWQEKFPTTG